MSPKLFTHRDPRDFYSEPNLITLLRLVGSLTLFTLAALKSSPTLNYIGLAVHWGGDVLDGFIARRFKQETILGAEIDIIADRVEILFFLINFIDFNPGIALPVVIYMVDFAFVDFYLGLQFVKFDIISPNYFDKVDRPVYRWNFSPLGKFANSTIVVLILIFLPQLQLLAAAWAVGLIVVKTVSAVRLFRIRLQNPGQAKD